MFSTPSPTQASSPKIPQRPVKNPKNLSIDPDLANSIYSAYLTPPKKMILSPNSINNEKHASKKVKKMNESEIESVTKNLHI
jgi:hypothetical protein